jgi:RNA polymerase sigma-70 factor (ECF subfamily)
MTDARQRAETAARTSYGRLLSILIARSRDIAAAEDALSQAFEAALRVWPDRGMPDNPEAWLITTARNHLSNQSRHQTVALAATEELLRRTDERSDPAPFPDDRLRLLFLCAHPALDEGIRTPLMLQCVLGLDAARIARAFLLPPATMGQRLSRAKAKIRDAGLRFVLSQAELSSDRLLDVLDAIYVAFSCGWEEGGDLTGEAIYLARLIVSLMPQEPEPLGLLALMLYAEARRPARRDAAGFVPLDRQDPRLWHRAMIIEAEGHLTAGSRFGRFGRYLCEAAIQSVHVQRGITGRTNYQALETLYALLDAHSPSIGATVGLAAVTLETSGAARALAVLDALPGAKVQTYQPYWATRTRILRAAGDSAGANVTRTQALSLTEDPNLRLHIATL